MKPLKKWVIISTAYGIALSLTIGWSTDMPARMKYNYSMPGVRVDEILALPDSKSISAIERNILTNQEDRQKHLSDICGQMHLPRPEELRYQKISSQNMIYDGQHKVVYCPVAKIASSSWKMTMANLSNKLNTSLVHKYGGIHDKGLLRMIGLGTVAEMPKETQQSKEKFYTAKKFIFVRHPLDRLLSAYLDKFTKPDDYFHHKYGKRIIQQFRINATEKEIQDGSDVTFSEFISYLIYSLKNRKYINDHWKPYLHLCNPCGIKYDFIGHLADINMEAKYVIKFVLGEKSSSVTFPHQLKSPLPEGKTIVDYYKQINEKDMISLLDLYKADFDMFGFKRIIPST